MSAANGFISKRALLAATAGLAMAAPMMANALDLRLVIPNVSSEKAPIPIVSWSWGGSNSSTQVGGAGTGQGKISLSDVTVQHVFDGFSPALFKSLVLAERYPKVSLIVYSSGGAGGRQQKLFTFELLDVLLTSGQSGGTADDPRPTENFSFNFGQIRYFSAISADPTFCYDVANGTSC